MHVPLFQMLAGPNNTRPLGDEIIPILSSNLRYSSTQALLVSDDLKNSLISTEFTYPDTIPAH